MQNRMRYGIAAGSLLTLVATSIPGVGAGAAPAKPVKANYELAARWTPAKVGSMIFDTAVAPHWMDSGDRFWYSFENSSGRKFYLVDPAKKSKSMVFDPAKLAASLTTATGLPYDSQHLPITAIRFVKNEGSIQFEVNVPRDAVIPGEKKTTGTAAATITPPTNNRRMTRRTRATNPNSSWAGAAAATSRRRDAIRSSSPSSTNWPRANWRCSMKRHAGATDERPRTRRPVSGGTRLCLACFLPTCPVSAP